MEIISVSDKIKECIAELNNLKEKIKIYADKKAESENVYKRDIALVMIGLKNGKEYSLNDETIKNPAATLIQKIAEGICWKQGIDKDKADAEYKGLMAKIDTVCSILNGWQSINRWLDNK